MGSSETQFVADWLAQSAAAAQAFASDEACMAMLVAMSDRIAGALRDGGKLLIAGNGGSAADAQHMAGEILGRMNYDRPALAAIALTTDTSAMTAIANDYGYDHLFERQVQGLGRPGDLFLGISTSGRSRNVLLALRAARAIGLGTLGFAGAQGGEMAECCDLLLRAPTPVTPIVQQIHITAVHVICSLVERRFYPRRG